MSAVPVAAPSAAPAGTISGVRSAVDAVVAAGVPGIVVFARDGDRTALLARGYSDPSRKVPMRASGRFRVGTTTRSFVATVVLQLVAEHRLSLDERVDGAAPGLLPKRDAAVTVRQLLQGKSGLWDYMQAPPWNRVYRPKEFVRTWTPQQLLAIGLARKPYAAPGARLTVSSTDWIVLGLLVEHVTGRSLRDELQQRLIAPLGLRSTSFSSGTGVPGGLVRGYARNHADVTGVNSSWAWANGSLVSTASDLAHFYRALLRGQLLPSSLLRTMEGVTWANRILGLGFGLGLERTRTITLAKHLPFFCRPAWGYEGSHLGYTSIALASLDGRRQVVILLDEDPGALTPQWQAPNAIFGVADAALCG